MEIYTLDMIQQFQNFQTFLIQKIWLFALM